MLLTEITVLVWLRSQQYNMDNIERRILEKFYCCLKLTAVDFGVILVVLSVEQQIQMTQPLVLKIFV